MCALVCRADLLPHCYLIIQRPWNVLLYGRVQPWCRHLPLTTAVSQSIPSCTRGLACVCAHFDPCPYVLVLFAHTKLHRRRTKLHRHRTKGQDKSSVHPHPVIMLNFGLHTLCRYLSLSFSLQDHQHWGGGPHQYAFQNVKNKPRRAHATSRDAGLIREINITLPTAVAYTQTRVMSHHLCCITESSK